jgi:VanZ family protein
LLVVVGSVLPASAPPMVALGSLHINHRVMHYSAYLALSLLAMIGSVNRCRGIFVGIEMFVLGAVLEGCQHFSPGRNPALGDAITNGLGVSTGFLLGMYIRHLIRIQDQGTKRPMA